ncbi:MAG: hypothetical protein ABW195_00245, partial [Ilumatobacteraceae bacterium]
PAACDAARVGRKAAALAKARAAGLPVGSGVVLTTQWCHDDRATVTQVWRIISHDGVLPLVVRPSAVVRDRARPADAGAIEPTVVVRDLDGFCAAVDAVRLGRDRAEANVPVLVQPHVAGTWHGVLFGDDSRPGRRRRRVVVARRGDDAGATPADDEWIAELDDAGRTRDVLSGGHLDHPPVEVLARLARLAERLAVAFDGAHDIEWAADGQGRVHLVRFRPVVRLRSTPTASAHWTGRCGRPPLALVPALVDDGRAAETAA